jgi:hypothetical protein
MSLGRTVIDPERTDLAQELPSSTSSEIPREPQICTARSTTRQIASAQNALEIAADCDTDRPWSSSQHA